MIDNILSRTTDGHIFGANFWHMQLWYVIWHRKDRPETKTHNSWSHFWGKFRPMHLLYLISLHERMTWFRDTQRLATFVGQISGTCICCMWHCTGRIDLRQRQHLVTFLGQILEHMHLLCKMAVKWYDRHHTQSHNSWSHFWGKFLAHAFVICDMAQEG